MFVFTRRKDEAIVIGDDVLVTVVDIEGDEVRLEIQTPADDEAPLQEIVCSTGSSEAESGGAE